MPKLSIYVSDELWERSREANPELNKSQLVQEALENLVEKSSFRPEYARKRPAGSKVQIESLRQRLATEAKQKYQAGYKTGLELAAKLAWENIEELVYMKWSVDGWIQRLRRIGEDGDAEKIERQLGESDLDRSHGVEPWSKSTYRLGVVEALRKVWMEVTGAESL